MGAWGFKNLENDTAGDWLYDLEENPTIEFMEETLDAVFEDEYLDLDTSSSALAALEVITFVNGNSKEDSEDFEEIDLSSIKKELNGTFYNKCIEVIGRILLKENNELYELWEQSESFKDWHNVILDLKNRIESLQN